MMFDPNNYDQLLKDFKLLKMSLLPFQIFVKRNKYWRISFYGAFETFVFGQDAFNQAVESNNYEYIWFVSMPDDKAMIIQENSIHLDTPLSKYFHKERQVTK